MIIQYYYIPQDQKRIVIARILLQKLFIKVVLKRFTRKKNYVKNSNTNISWS
jgi:hypothetical protein